LGPGDVGPDDAKRPLRLADPATRALAAALRALAAAAPLRRVLATLVVPASTFGRKAVEDLGEQTIALLNMQGSEADGADEGLEEEEADDDDETSLPFRCAPLDPAAAPSARVQTQLAALFDGTPITVQLMRAPMFFGEIFSVSVELESPPAIDEVRR